MVCETREAGVIDRNELGNGFYIDVRRWETACVQLSGQTGLWGMSLVGVYRSIDRAEWFPTQDPCAFSASGISDALDVSGVCWLWIKTDIAEGSAATSRVSVCLKARA